MESKKRAYTTPEMMVYPMLEDNLLQAASGNAGTIGYGGSGGDAKRNTGVEEWEEEGASPNPSEGGEPELAGSSLSPPLEGLGEAFGLLLFYSSHTL